MAQEEILQKKLVRLILITPILIVLGMAIYAEIMWLPKEQPIAFPHDLHAGTRQIDCQYCHRGSRDGYIAGVISVQDCWACHRTLVEKNAEGKVVPMHENSARPELVKFFKQYVEQRRDIEWFKYYDLPEHVKFAHKAHIAAGFDCAQCHGDVAQMKTIQMQQRPTMGWCVSCHRANDAPVDCTTCHR